ncbi:hypothetical protein BC834DRAFT_971859 [Gloeopeniophorella convolvens]|nr:hypothetical protein BC834DRAFT_971859 [Gloeopeniophorella convolvens]
MAATEINQDLEKQVPDAPEPIGSGYSIISDGEAAQARAAANNSLPKTRRKYQIPGGGDIASDSDTAESNTAEYDERAAKLWSVYVQEGENHDKAMIETWKDDMEGIIIFAGLFSASLTSFLVESYQNLQPDRAEQTVLLLQQAVTLLSQVTQQLGPDGNQVSIQLPSRLDLGPNPDGSDIRVNILWFMSLIFSLGAALAATIVQQWVREYMHVFQRYNSSLKRARLRQFLYEGAMSGRMTILVDGVPVLIHISLFLFFAGLCDFLFKINETVAIVVTVMVSLCGALYIGAMVSPMVYAQSPYQTPLSGLFWWLFYKFHGRAAVKKQINTSMSDGRVQLAMEQSDERLQRDARGICWVIENLTEDYELEPFVQGIPGTLNTSWGRDVWEAIAKNPELLNHASQELELPHSRDAVADFSGRITRLLKTCTDHGMLEETKRRLRARACVDAALAFVLNMDGHWEWFAEGETLARALAYLGRSERITEWSESPPGFDGPFAVRWLCMTAMTVRTQLRTEAVRSAATRAIATFAEVRGESGDQDVLAARTAKILDRSMHAAWEAATELRRALVGKTGPPDEVFPKILEENQAHLRQLEMTWNNLGWAQRLDERIVDLSVAVSASTSGVLAYLPGRLLAWAGPAPWMPSYVSSMSNWQLPLIAPPRALVDDLRQCSWTLREIERAGSVGQVNQPDVIEGGFGKILDAGPMKLMAQSQTSFTEQLRRLQDLRDGGMVYTLELFLTAVHSSKETQTDAARETYLKTYATITADWQLHKNNLGTQTALASLLTSSLNYALPELLTEELIKLTANVLQGTSGRHVSEAVMTIRTYEQFRVPGSAIANEALAKLLPPSPEGQQEPVITSANAAVP